MSDLSELWATAEVKTAKSNDFADITVGNYELKLEDVTLDKTKTPEKVSLKYRVTAGEFENRVIFVNQQLNPVGVSILKELLLKLGYTGAPKSTDDLLAALLTYKGTRLDGYVSSRKSDFNGKTYTHYSVRLNSVLDDEEIAFAAL